MRQSLVTAALCGVIVCLATLSHAEPTIDAAKIKFGARTYDKYCSTCHGEDLINNTGVSFDLRRLRADEHPRFVHSVLNGKNAMPSWRGKLTDEQIDALWTYIRTNAYDAK